MDGWHVIDYPGDVTPPSFFIQGSQMPLLFVLLFLPLTVVTLYLVCDFFFFLLPIYTLACFSFFFFFSFFFSLNIKKRLTFLIYEK